MKLHIIAVLSISILSLSSCGGTKTTSTEPIEDVQPEKPRNTALEWSAASSDALYLHRQLFGLAKDRLALLLTTSLGEATAYTGMGNPKSVEVDEIYKRFGSKVILFPNPTFNRK